MKWIRLTFMMLGLALFLVSACADRRVVPAPDTHIPPASVPRIGGSAPGETRHAARDTTRPNARDVGNQRTEALNRVIRKAERQLSQNRPKAAFATLEQALAMDGQDPYVWHLMARVRLAQGRYRQAISLAQKSDTLAGSHPGLKEKNADLIRRARASQG